MKVKHTFQKDDSGCGIACISMVVGKSYYEVKAILFEQNFYKNLDDDLSTTFKELAKAFDLFKINTSKKRKFKMWKNIPAKIAIASTNYDKYGIWHWVLFVRDIEGFFIYDPGKPKKKIRDLRGKMSGWFIEIL